MTKKNIIKAGVAGIATMIPGVNGLFEFYSTFCQGQSDERRDKVEEEFKQKFDDIQNYIDHNPSNFAIFLNAVKGAFEDIADEKIKNYVNAMVSAIQNENFDNTKIHIFLNLLRKYSILHIKVLEYFNHPHSKRNNNGIQMNVSEMRSTEQYIADIIGEEEPELANDISLLELAVKDLYADGLLQISRLEQLHSPILNGFSKKTTSLGEEFLNFIAD